MIISKIFFMKKMEFWIISRKVAVFFFSSWQWPESKYFVQKLWWFFLYKRHNCCFIARGVTNWGIFLCRYPVFGDVSNQEMLLIQMCFCSRIYCKWFWFCKVKKPHILLDKIIQKWPLWVLTFVIHCLRHFSFSHPVHPMIF